MMRFFISDTHFGHTNIIRYSNRPFKDVPHMNEELIKRWNSVVEPNDIVYHLGDVAMGPKDQWDGLLTRLNGRLRLVVGNHEPIFAAESEKHQARWRPEFEKWFEHITTNWKEFSLFDGREVNLSHFPYEADHMDNARYMEHRLPDEGTTLVHGHTHAEYEKHGMDARVSRSNKGTLQIHVGADAWDYTPVAEAEVIDLIERNS